MIRTHGRHVGSSPKPSRSPRELLADTRAWFAAAFVSPDVHVPWSEVRAPSFRLRLHVPNHPPSPCSIGWLGTGCTEVEVAHARLVDLVVIRTERVRRRG